MLSRGFTETHLVIGRPLDLVRKVPNLLRALEPIEQLVREQVALPLRHHFPLERLISVGKFICGLVQPYTRLIVHTLLLTDHTVPVVQ
jgi:hypothetical protein